MVHRLLLAVVAVLGSVILVHSGQVCSERQLMLPATGSAHDLGHTARWGAAAVHETLFAVTTLHCVDLSVDAPSLFASTVDAPPPHSPPTSFDCC